MYRFLLNLIKQRKQNIFYFVLLSVSIGIVDLATIYLVSSALQITSTNTELKLLLWGNITLSNIYKLCFFALITKVALHLLYKISLPIFIYNLQANIRDEVFSKIYEDFTDEVESSSFSENYFKLNAASTHVSINMLFPLFQLFVDFIVCTIILIFIIYQQPLLSLSVMAFFICIAVAWLVFTKNLSKRLGETRNRALEKSTQWTRFANDHHIQFKSLGVIKAIKDRYNLAVREYSDAMVKFKIISDIPRIVFEFAIILVVLGWLIFSTYENSQLIGTASMDETLAVLLLLPRLLPFLNSLSTIYNTVSNQKDSLNVLAKVYNEQAKYGQKYRKDKLSNLEICFKNIFLRNKKAEIKKIRELKFSAGNFYCIVGASGSGKSTLVKSLAGLHQASSGDVMIMELGRIDTLQKMMGFVSFCPQTIPEIDITVNEFLGLGYADDASKILEVHSQISLGEFSIDAKLMQLSGGQRQRVLIMKSILHPAIMYIFDEPTSGLDSSLSTKLIEYIKRELVDSIVICVTHDPTLMALADEVISIENVH